MANLSKRLTKLEKLADSPPGAEQKKSRNLPAHLWKPGQSGNPNGAPRDPKKLEAREMLKKATPELIQTAINLAKGVGNEGKPDTYVLVNLLKKILPDKIEVEGTMELIKKMSEDEIDVRIRELIAVTGITLLPLGTGQAK